MRRTLSLPSLRGPQPSASSSPLPTLGTPAETPQPAPSGNGRPVVDVVIADVESRRDFGLRKYGTLLKTYNGRDALWDLYQELLDAVMYLRQFQLERVDPSSPVASVTEGTWSPVLNRDGILSGHVTYVEGALYWRPIGKLTQSSANSTPVAEPETAPGVTPEQPTTTESYTHRAGTVVEPAPASFALTGGTPTVQVSE